MDRMAGDFIRIALFLQFSGEPQSLIDNRSTSIPPDKFKFYVLSKI